MADKSGNSDGEPVVVVVEEPLPEIKASIIEDQSTSLSTKISEIKTPKQVYFEKMIELDEQVKAALRDLFEMGFTNFEVNSGLLVKYENNVEMVSNLLCEQMLSESCINAIYK